jgi:tetrahydromethanopterin S-methyltransferase subunit A
METIDNVVSVEDRHGLIAAAAQLRAAAEAKKCSACGCLHNALAGIEQALPPAAREPALAEAIALAQSRLSPQRYECLGCDECYPAIALNALGAAGHAVEAATCPTEAVEARAGWPSLPGDYRVFRYHAPVAVCALNSDNLIGPIAAAEPEAIAIGGTLHTENLGIERLIANVLGNPFIRFVVVCGYDSRQLVGHLPGQSLIALSANGVNAERRIVGAKGKRPFLRNLSAAAIERFRTNVEVVDLVGVTDVERISAVVRDCASRAAGPSLPFAEIPAAAPIPVAVPERMVSDPAGYFVIFVDRARKLLSLEHYETSGVLTTIIEAKSAAEIYTTAIERAPLTRLDHAAYLGREFARGGSLALGRSLRPGRRARTGTLKRRMLRPRGVNLPSPACGRREPAKPAG